MKRAAFTMIELIFVIVILGILATIALPKLASLEDDAIVSKEKSAIGSARSSVITLQSRAKLTSGDTFNYKIEEFSTTPANHGREVTVIVTKSTDMDTASSYPKMLSVDSYTNGTAKPQQAQETATLAGGAMAMVLSADERDAWGTKADGNNTKIKGPASGTIAAETAEYDLAGSWLYQPATGRFNYEGNVTY